MLSPSVVGDIAHGHVEVGGLTEDDLRALIRHALAYPVCAALDANRATAPTGANLLLRTAARQQALRSISVAATATRTSQLLGDAGVRSIAYKGPALAVQTTGSWQGRGSADVDVLIDHRDTAATDRALRAAGCVSRAGYDGAPSPWERYHRPERAYSGLPVTIDLHWRVDPGPGYFSARFDDLWSRREHLAIDGLDVDTFDRVDALLATAVHGAKERWSRWSWPLDAVRQVEALEQHQWSEVARRAAETGSSRAVDLCVAIAAQCGAQLPPGVAPSSSMTEVARSWLALSAAAAPVVWTREASLYRRRARWILADRPTAAADAFARAVARLVADRRAPGAPQRKAGDRDD